MRGHFASRDCYWGWGRNIIHDSAAKSVLPLSCLLSPETVSLQNAGHKLALTKVTIALNDSMEGSEAPKGDRISSRATRKDRGLYSLAASRVAHRREYNIMARAGELLFILIIIGILILIIALNVPRQ